MSQAAPARTVITGFRAFPGVAQNPSARLLEFIAERPAALPSGTQMLLLDTIYAAIGQAREAILADPPAALLMFGYSARATGFKLERSATDICSPAFADAAGFHPEARSGPPDLLTNRTLDLAALAAMLEREGLPASLSDDAGEYVCNHTYHTMLSAIAGRSLPTRALFVHIPAIAGSPLAAASASAMELADMARGAALIARFLARGGS